MPLASVSSIHICASSGDFDALRQRMVPVDQAAVTLVLVLPFMIELHTRPCMVQPQIGVSSPPRPWLSQLNHQQMSPSSFRFGVARMLPPRFAKNRLSAFFSLAIPSYS